MPDRFNMSDVMISYARQDKPFVQQLEQALREDSLEIWVDWEDIALTADWWTEIQAGIEAAHTIVFVISPASARSEVCAREVEHAVLHHKRLVPILRTELSADDHNRLPEAIKSHNWIYFRESDHFRRAYLMLRTTLETDLEHKTLHTRFLVRAREWEERGHSASLLLRGEDLRGAERWLAQSIAGQTPEPTPRQIDYIRASRRAAGRRQQLTLSSVVVVLVVLSILLVTAFGQSKLAGDQAQTAVLEINLRATQESRVLDSLANAATAKAIEMNSGVAALTAQARMLAAQTAAAQSLADSQNNQTRAYVAQQNILTATVLQGQFEEEAETAQAQQAQSGAAATQARQQVQAAQEEATQASKQSALLSTQGAEAATAAVNMVAAIQTQAFESQLQAIERATQANVEIQNVENAGTAFWGTPVALYATVTQAVSDAAAAQIMANDLRLTAMSISDANATRQAIRDHDFRDLDWGVDYGFSSHLYANEVYAFGFDGALHYLTEQLMKNIRAACLSPVERSPDAQAICATVDAIPILTPSPTDTLAPTASPTPTETPTPMPVETPTAEVTPSVTEDVNEVAVPSMTEEALISP